MGVYIEHTNIGWIVYQPAGKAVECAQRTGCPECVAHENHTPIQTTTEMLKSQGYVPYLNSYISMHHISRKLIWEMGGVAQIYHALIEQFRKDTIPITFIPVTMSRTSTAQIQLTRC